jgi:hypothetical protein
MITNGTTATVGSGGTGFDASDDVPTTATNKHGSIHR